MKEGRMEYEGRKNGEVKEGRKEGGREEGRKVEKK